jgi:hypothetical protein
MTLETECKQPILAVRKQNKKGGDADEIRKA